MLITKAVEVLVPFNRIKWYEEKGYEILRSTDNRGRNTIGTGTKLRIKVEDLTLGSGVLVDIQCDCCKKKIIGTKWQNYLRSVHEDGKYYCGKCASKLFGAEKTRKLKLKKGKSFKQWCCENLSNEEADELLSRWDYTLNGKRPDDVSFCSKGLSGKGYWFKCSRYHEHESEQKIIQNITGGHKASINCAQCNSISVTHPYLTEYLTDKGNALKYSAGSSVKIIARCPDCGQEKEMKISDLTRNGLGCPSCSEGASYPEKFLFSLLRQLDINFRTQLSKTVFDWCKNYRYDFYINNISCIIETHGSQHYVESNWAPLNEIKENDRTKKQLALFNGIFNYVVLNCINSDMKWIRNSIMNSNLPGLLRFREDSIDWLMCHEHACSSLVRETCDMWKTGIRNTTKIADILKIGRKTAGMYLKQGAELELCDYDPKISTSEASRKSGKKNIKKVICLTTNEIFPSMNDAAFKYGMNPVGVSKCCIGKRNSSGKHPITGERLTWKYYDEHMDNNRIQQLSLI